MSEPDESEVKRGKRPAQPHPARSPLVQPPQEIPPLEFGHRRLTSGELRCSWLMKQSTKNDPRDPLQLLSVPLRPDPGYDSPQDPFAARRPTSGLVRDLTVKEWKAYYILRVSAHEALKAGLAVKHAKLRAAQIRLQNAQRAIEVYDNAIAGMEQDLGVLKQILIEKGYGSWSPEGQFVLNTDDEDTADEGGKGKGRARPMAPAAPLLNARQVSNENFAIADGDHSDCQDVGPTLDPSV